MEIMIVWIVFAGALLFLGSFLVRKVSRIRKAQKAQMEQFYEKQEKYRHFTSEKFDEVPMDELVHAVLHHIKAKEDKIFEGDSIDDVELIDVLTEGEKMIYTIAQIEGSLDGGRGSLHSFFVEEMYQPWLPYMEKAFHSVNCFEIVELLKSAAMLAQIIEEDLDEEEHEIEGDYASYNFSDYTRELLTLMKSSGIIEKTGKYIKDNKEMFIDKEEIETGSEIDEEGTSDEI